MNRTKINNYIKMAVRYGVELYFFFNEHDAEEVLAAYAAATRAKVDHDGLARGARTAGGGKAHLSIWKKCCLLQQSIPEVGEFVEIVPVHNDALLS